MNFAHLPERLRRNQISSCIVDCELHSNLRDFLHDFYTNLYFCILFRKKSRIFPKFVHKMFIGRHPYKAKPNQSVAFAALIYWGPWSLGFMIWEPQISVLLDVRNSTTFFRKKCFISPHKSASDNLPKSLTFEGLKVCLNCRSRKTVKMSRFKTPEWIFAPVNLEYRNWALFSDAHTGLYANPAESGFDVIEDPRHSSC